MTVWGLLVGGLDVQGPSNTTVHTLGGPHISTKYLLHWYLDPLGDEGSASGNRGDKGSRA